AGVATATGIVDGAGRVCGWAHERCGGGRRDSDAAGTVRLVRWTRVRASCNGTCGVEDTHRDDGHGERVLWLAEGAALARAGRDSVRYLASGRGDARNRLRSGSGRTGSNADSREEPGRHYFCGHFCYRGGGRSSVAFGVVLCTLRGGGDSLH